MDFDLVLFSLRKMDSHKTVNGLLQGRYMQNIYSVVLVVYSLSSSYWFLTFVYWR
jgi:hypothetical protein